MPKQQPPTPSAYILTHFAFQPVWRKIVVLPIVITAHQTRVLLRRRRMKWNPFFFLALRPLWNRACFSAWYYLWALSQLLTERCSRFWTDRDSNRLCSREGYHWALETHTRGNTSSLPSILRDLMEWLMCSLYITTSPLPWLMICEHLFRSVQVNGTNWTLQRRLWPLEANGATVTIRW